MTFMTVPVITWAAHTRHMTGPHTKYFPTYFYNPDIFCLPFISFLLTGCSQDQWDAWRVAWHTHMFWHQKTAKKINECVCVIMTWVTSWHHQPSWHRAPGTGGGDQASCVSRCLVTLWFIFRCNKVRCPQGTDTHGQQGAINYASITILTSMTTL